MEPYQRLKQFLMQHQLGMAWLIKCVPNIGGGFSPNKKFQEAASIIKDAGQSYFWNELLPLEIIGNQVRGELREY